MLSELVADLEADGQHARAVAVLEEHEPVMGWLHRFQYACNALMAGTARRDPARPPGPRGWRYVLTGGVLASLSPYGFDAGMTGRRAYLSDSMQGCAPALARLKLILDPAGAAPRTVALLPDRSGRILGAAPERDDGDGSTPDPGEGLRRFAEAVSAAGTRDRDGGWIGGIREYIPSAGPVPGSRFL